MKNGYSLAAILWFLSAWNPFSATVGCAQVVHIDQAWNDATRQLFYTTSQGSRMMPYEWFLALENHDNTELFCRTRVYDLGYLPNDNLLTNRDHLPIGFTLDIDVSGAKHVGLTCAACHTNVITYRDKSFQIDGAPTLADMWGLIVGIRDSLEATLNDEAKFSRFSVRVLRHQPSTAELTELRSRVQDFLGAWRQFAQDSSPDATGKGWGRGRLDAFGMIFNRVSSINLDIRENSASPNAAVSYPFLWGTSFEDRVQWNGSAPNRNDIERLARNVGEVLGVFAETDLERASLLRPYYRTSARRLFLLGLENWLKSLTSPVWPDELGQIDQAKADRGKVLYDRHCVECHTVIPHGKQSTPVKVSLIAVEEIQTDKTMALNAVLRTAKTGRLQSSQLPGTQPLPDSMPTGALVGNVVQGAVISPFLDVAPRSINLFAIKDDFLGLTEHAIDVSDLEVKRLLRSSDIQNEANLSRMLDEYRGYVRQYNQELLDTANRLRQGAPAEPTITGNPYVYKARPLDGIWATAPYLHNGSVPNLYELLLPASKRTKIFSVGSHEFDPRLVGFSIAGGPGTTEMDCNVPGNLNTGHDQYGNESFSDEERWQLLEYLKSL